MLDRGAEEYFHWRDTPLTTITPSAVQLMMTVNQYAIKNDGLRVTRPPLQ